MRRGVVAISACVLAGACAASADGATDRVPPPPSTAFATLPPQSTTTTQAPTTTLAPATDATPPTASVPALDDPAGTTDESSESVTDELAPVVDVDPTDENDTGGESEADEPTFDIGPQPAIDVDLARFPPDDAGQGGTGGDGGAGADTATGWAGVDRYLESVLIRPGNTAAAIAVSIDGDVVHTAAFGQRDPATGDPAEAGDRFRIASISKPITAIVALALVEDGQVGLDEPIGRVVAEHIDAGAVSSSASGLTLRRLLTHRSGFGKYESTFFRKGADDCVDAARTGLRNGAGGGGYTYSNMNYCVAGLLIEAVTGLTYEQAVYRYLLTPLGISGMRLPPTIDPGPGEVQHQTTAGRNYMETLGAAGAWIASPAELVTIFDSLDLSTSGFKPLSQATVFEMVIPPGAQYGERGYGLGVISYGDGRFGHTGTIESTHAMLLNRGDRVTWAITVAGQYPGESTDLERIMNRALEAGGFVTG